MPARYSTLTGCYFFSSSKRSNQEKDAEIETLVDVLLTRIPKISAVKRFLSSGILHLAEI